MALSPADFAAYSRATGTPYPEDPEEKAELAPEVLEFRRNQLRGQQQESNLPGILGAAALGLGALAGGVGIARALAGKRAQVAPSKIPEQNLTGVRELGTVARQRAADETVRQARNEPMPGVRVVDLSGQKTDLPLARTPGTFREFSRDVSGVTAAEKLAQDPELVSLVQKQAAEELSEARSQQSKAQAEYRNLISGIADDIIAQERAAVQAPVLNQTIGALESGEDQMTGRTMRGIQRNEDLDASQVNAVARQTGNVDVAASITPDGIPVDQTNVLQQAQSFLTQERQKLNSQFTPTRTERILSANTAVAEAAELYAATGDPSVLSRFSKTPSSPLTVKPATQMSINEPELPTKQFFKATGLPEYTGDLLAEDIELTNQISNLGAQQQTLLRKAQELGEQELMLRVAMDREPAAGGAYSRMFAQVKNQQQNLPDPSSLNVDIGDALAERDYVRGRIKSLQDLGSTYKMANVQEGVRPYYEYDELGQIIPETLEIRGGRQSVDLGPKTGGGRLVAEYDPAGQTGSTKGIYGIEQTAKRSGPTTRPTRMTTNELVQEALEQASASPEGDVPIPPPQEQVTRTYGPQASQKSLIASEALRRARIEGRDPQAVLRNLGFNV